MSELPWFCVCVMYIHINYIVPVTSELKAGWGSRPSEILLSQGDGIHIFHVDEDLVTQSFMGEIPSLCSYLMLVIWMFLLGICFCKLFVAFHLFGRFFTIRPMSSWKRKKMEKDQRKKRRNHLDRTTLTGHLGPFPLVDKCLGSEKPWRTLNPTFKPSTPVVVSPGRPSTNAFCTPNLSTTKREVVSGQLSIWSWKSKHALLTSKKTRPGEKKAFGILNKDFPLVKSDYNSFNFT